MTFRSAIQAGLVLGLLASTAAACGAPPARPATGPVADDVLAAIERGTESFDHSDWGELLAGGTRDGLVDYTYFQRHQGELDAYLDRLAHADLAALAPRELEALLINAYNALTIRVILDHPHVSSIREIDGVWTRITHPVGGHELTLDEIEHNLLRPFFRDPRVHFVLNCASMSCPPLPPWAFMGEALEEQYEELTRAFLRNPENVRVEDGRLLLSRYFDWYGEDFILEDWDPRAPTIPAFVARYASPEVADFIRERGDPPVRFLEYDWSLNAVVPPDHGLAGAEAAEAESGLVADLRRWVTGLGPAAPLVYVLAYIVAVILMVPASALTIGAGIAFGLTLGTAVVVVGATVGAALAFLLARYFLRERVAEWLEGKAKLSAVDRAVEREGWKVVALTRLSPAFPFNVQNYFYGLTRVGFGPYVLASAVAMFPGTLLYVYIGVAGAEVVAAATGAADLGRTALQVAGLLATVAVVVLVTRVARRELRRVTDEADAEEVGRARDGPDPAAA